jgi:hypothetical protein
VDETDLLAGIEAAVPLSKTGPAAGRVLETDDVSALFGLDMAAAEAPEGVPSAAKQVAATLEVEGKRRKSAKSLEQAAARGRGRLAAASARTATARQPKPKPVKWW